MNDRRIVRPWDAPVVRALDEVERLPGFEPDHVLWDNFLFIGSTPDRRMQSVFIYASSAMTTGSPFVRFAVGDYGFVVTGGIGRQLTASDVARVLMVPVESADKAIQTLAPALEEALDEYNAAHAPRAVNKTTSRGAQLGSSRPSVSEVQQTPRDLTS